MAFQNISASNSTPFFENLIAQGSLPNNVFAFYLAEEGSELYLGGINNKLYKGNITYVPVTEGVMQLFRVVLGAMLVTICFRVTGRPNSKPCISTSRKLLVLQMRSSTLARA